MVIILKGTYGYHTKRDLWLSYLKGIMIIILKGNYRYHTKRDLRLSY